VIGVAGPGRDLPTGTVTFLRTDVEGSMRLVRELGPTWDTVNGTHMGLVRRAIEAHGGTVIRTEGDAIFAVFPEARAGVSAAIAAQREIGSHAWPEGAPVRVRMGLHSGEAYLAGDDYGGFEVNRAARIAATGHGGQIVVSETTRALIEDALPDGVSVRDLGRHALRDLPRPEPIHQIDAVGLQTSFPPLRTIDSTIGNLPERLTSFLGRERELDELGSLLASHRLVTLTGPGGIGKTSLAIELARAHASDYPDGAWLVELDDLHDESLVRSVVARTLGLFDGPERTAVDALLPYLAERSMLLILDNFEHLLGAATEVLMILRASPGSRMLVASRAPLRVAGEQDFPVEPLAVATAHDPSIALFVERARNVRPGFVIGADPGPVQEICRLLDGLPLGIELAAARVSLLPVAAIRDRLQARLPLPGPDQRGVPDRQRTLDDAIGWSYALLGPDRQRLLRDLSVFDGGFDLVQAQAVHDGGDVLEPIVDLVDQSLVAREADGAFELRFHLLKTIETFALRELRAEGREDDARRRHALAFLGLAEESARELPGALMRGVLQRLRLDHANLRSAVRWSIDHGEVEIALRLVGALWRYWQFDGHVSEGAALAVEALSMPGADAPTAARIAAVTAMGGLAYWQAHSAAASRWYREELELAIALGDRAAEADATFNGIYGLFINDDTEGALRMQEAAQRLYGEIGDERGYARVAWTRGTVFMQLGRLDEAEQIFRQGLETFRATGDPWYEALAYGSLAWCAFMRGDGRAAVDPFVRSLALSHALGDLASLTITLEVAAILAIELDRYETGAVILGALETATATYGVVSPAGLARLISRRSPADQIAEALGPEASEAAKARGRRLNLDEAVELIIAMAHDAGLGLGPSIPPGATG
jgi:predicted ATPase/class 3 adenylate cyclase